MDEVKARHRKELKDLQSQITQKKKSATKKTRKTVNDECDRLEQDVKARQVAELAALEGASQDEGEDGQPDLLDSIVSATDTTSNLSKRVEKLHVGARETEPAGVDDLEATTSRKPNRQKARLARRAAEQETVVAKAAEEAASLPDLRKMERERLLVEFEARKLVEKVVAANGHCLYSSIADQLHQIGLDPKTLEHDVTSHEGRKSRELGQDDYKDVRKQAAHYIAQHPDDFTAFLEEPMDTYLHKIRDTGEWGGQLELQALSQAYSININVLQADGRIEKFEASKPKSDQPAWLAYYRHGFGLGEHYNSLRKQKT